VIEGVTGPVSYVLCDHIRTIFAKPPNLILCSGRLTSYIPSSTCNLAAVSRSPILHMKSPESASFRSLMTNVCLPSSSVISNLPLTTQNNHNNVQNDEDDDDD